MKALVTGGTGFIGRYVIDELLKENHAVRVFSRGDSIPEEWRGKSVEIFQGDLKDFPSIVDAMEDMDVFYHIGEIKNRTRSSSEKNVRMVEHVVSNLEKKGIKRLVFVSSITVAGIPSEIPASEKTEPEIRLRDHYTSHKERCEGILNGLSSPVEYAIIRPAPVYGPGSMYWGRLIDLLDKIGPIGLPFVGDAHNLAPLIYVKDLARAVCIAGVQEGVSGQTFNLTDGFRHSWHDFLRTVAEGLGRRMRIISLPPLLIRFPAILFDFFSGAFGLELDASSFTEYFSHDLFFENEKARLLLRWEPQYRLSEGIKEMLLWHFSR